MPLKPFAPNSGADKKIFLLKPRGFCAGVVRAIDVVKIALDLYGPPVYVRKEIVHNKHVVDELREAGAVFVEELDEVPSRARAIFSAHGVAPSVRKQALERQLDIIDATCPLVTKVHLEAVRFARDGYSIVLIGHKDHDEVIGTLGEVPERSHLVETVEDVDRLELSDPLRVRYLTQTTLSLDETREIIGRLKERFPFIEGPPAQDICYATENRQMAVKAVSQAVELLLVVGSQNSSNSKRLRRVRLHLYAFAYPSGGWQRRLHPPKHWRERRRTKRRLRVEHSENTGHQRHRSELYGGSRIPGGRRRQHRQYEHRQPVPVPRQPIHHRHQPEQDQGSAQPALRIRI